VCENGCESGACKELSNCNDSDGLDYFNKGYITFNSARYNDYCYNNQLLVEMRCLGGVSSTQRITCQNGCENGACKPELSNPSINILSPVGGETWQIGSKYTPNKYKITWKSENLNSDLTIKIIFNPQLE
jgi:hypothetical protein